MIKDLLEIKKGYVYLNDAGECRLVVSIEGANHQMIVIWRTADPYLPKGAKAQGSATATSFQKWATKMRGATDEELGAFQVVERNRHWVSRDRAAVQRMIKHPLQTK